MNYLNTINTIDTPHNFARRIHLKLKKNKVEVPGYGELLIQPNGYVHVSGVDHAFGAGTLFDLCALKHRYSTANNAEQAYENALAEIVREYDDRLHLPCSFKELVRTALNTRKLLDFCRKQALNRKNVKNSQKTSFKLTAPNRKIFTTILSDLLGQDIYLGNEQIKVWYAWPGLISSIEVLSGNTVHKKYILDTTFSMSYTLLELYDPDKTIFLNTTSTQINAYNYFFTTTDYPFHAVEARACKKSKNLWLPPRAVIAPPAINTAELFNIAPLITEKVTMCPFEKLTTLHKEKLPTIYSFIKNAILMTIIAENTISPRIQDMLVSEVLPRTLCTEIKEALQNKVDLSVLSQFRNLIPSTALYARGDKVYYESYRGYDVVIKDEKFRVSNFTLDFSNYLAFPKQDGLHLRGRVIMETRAFDVTMPSDALNTPTQVDKAVKRAELLSGSKGSIPIVYTPLEFKIICNTLRTKVEDLQVLEGLTSLGWDFVSRTFASPTFLAGVDTFRFRKATPHPEKPRLAVYSYELPENTPKFTLTAKKKISVSMWKVACLCMAQVALGSAGLPNCGVAIKHTEEALELLKTLFSALGQTAPIYLGTNNRALDNNEFYGYPFYGFSGSALTIENSKFPILGLAEVGVELTGTVSDACLLQTVLHHVLPLLADAPAYNRANGITTAERLIKEGAALLTAAGFKVPQQVFASSFPLLEKFLAKGSPAYNYDMHTNTAELEWPAGALEEINTLEPLPKPITKNKAVVSGTTLFGVLTNWFG